MYLLCLIASYAVKSTYIDNKSVIFIPRENLSARQAGTTNERKRVVCWAFSIVTLMLVCAPVAIGFEFGIKFGERTTLSYRLEYSQRDLETNFNRWAERKAPELLNKVDGLIPIDVLVGRAHQARISPRALLAYIKARYGQYEYYLKKYGYERVLSDIDAVRLLAADALHDYSLSSAFALNYEYAYKSNFGDGALVEPGPYRSGVTVKLPKDLLQLPFLRGETWYLFGGPHQDYSDNINTLPFNALDFGAEWSKFPTNTQNHWVAAVFDGTYYQQSSCHFSVQSLDKQWVLDYLHTANHQIAHGASVRQNEKLANYAGTQAQSACLGGPSSHPHLHISLWHLNADGQTYSPAALNGATFSGYRYYTSQTTAYDHSCAKSYFEKNSERYCPTIPTTINPRGLMNDLVEEEGDILMLVIPLLTQ